MRSRIDRRVLVAGLCTPGLGALLRGQVALALLAAWSVGAVLLMAAADYAGVAGDERTLSDMAALQTALARGAWAPTVVWLLVLAAAVHVAAAVGAAWHDD
jgi:hypothetical protein